MTTQLSELYIYTLSTLFRIPQRGTQLIGRYTFVSILLAMSDLFVLKENSVIFNIFIISHLYLYRPTLVLMLWEMKKKKGKTRLCFYRYDF